MKTILFVFLFYAARVASGQTNLKFNEITHAPWTQNSNSVLSPAAGSSTEVDGMKATYQYDVGTYGKTSLHITAFISNDGRKIWAGLEQDFYVELNSGMVGAKLDNAGIIRWSESLVQPNQLSKTNINSVIAAFQTNVDLVTALKTMGATADDVYITEHLTDLRQIFDPWAFTNGKYSSFSCKKLVSSVQINHDVVQITLENSASNFKGSVWIDPLTRKVTKAIEGAKQVFP